jgi:hypothetical protein
MSDNNVESPEDSKPVVFRKTKSEKWAVMGPVETLQKALADNGGKVKVLKKSGDTSEFTVVSLGSPFDVDGVKMCYGYDSLPDESSSDTAPAPKSNNATSAPQPDSSEPLPEFQGSAEDERPF